MAAPARRRWIWITLFLVGVVAAIGYNYRPQPSLVETSKASRGPLRVTIEEEGKTRVSDRFVVSAPVAGYMRRIRLDEGDAVMQGQVLATVEPPRAPALDPRARAQSEAQVGAALSSLAAAREQVRAAGADTRYWEVERGRLEKLVKTGDLPRDRYDRAVLEDDRARSALREAEQRVRVAEAELRVARAAVGVSSTDSAGEAVTVRSPVGGRVLKVVRDSEGVVNLGEPLVELGAVRSLEVLVELLSADAVKIGPGTRVSFTRWGGEKPLDGAVRLVEPQAFTKVSALGVEEQRVNVIVDITSPAQEWSRLGAGYRVEASFVLWEGTDVLQVPASSLFRFEDGWAVFTIENGMTRRRKVQVGHRTGVAAEILSGLNEGDAVITHPDSTMEENKPVMPRS